ncbi:MAG: hypothetical protein IH993_02455 [Proteobacteria bacterium]|nr:hypothetical protein [Pseudomonadota bacterium]
MSVSETRSVEIAGEAIEIWPAGLEIEDWLEPVVKIVEFDDTEVFHSGLIAKIQDLENDATFTKKYDHYIGSSKIYHLDRWGCREADLVNARAIELFKQVMGCDEAVVDLSWTNVYRDGDYCIPHSHVRATASIVYFLDLGTDNPEGPGHGRFCFADPRLKICCQKEAHAMTTPCAPKVSNGTMIIFPGKLVHFVDAYTEPGTRLTLSWNINQTSIPGTPTY